QVSCCLHGDLESAANPVPAVPQPGTRHSSLRAFRRARVSQQHSDGSSGRRSEEVREVSLRRKEPGARAPGSFFAIQMAACSANKPLTADSWLLPAFFAVSSLLFPK